MQNKKSVIRAFDWDRLVNRLEGVVGDALGKTETQIQVMEDGMVYPISSKSLIKERSSSVYNKIFRLKLMHVSISS